jgi:hypothetical protein
MNLKVKTNKKTSVLSFENFLVFQMVWFGSNDLVRLLMVRLFLVWFGLTVQFSLWFSMNNPSNRGYSEGPRCYEI